jgi:hypothetical protein
MEVLQLGGRRRAQLVAQQDAQLVVDAQGLGDVPAAGERLHEEAVTRLPEGRALDELARGPLGRAEVGRPRPSEPWAIQSSASSSSSSICPRRAWTHSSSKPGRKPARSSSKGGPRVRAGPLPVLRGGRHPRGRERGGRLADVRPDRRGQPKPDAVATLELRGPQRPAQARQDGTQRGERIARRAMRPEDLDELRAACRLLRARQQVGEQRRGLATRGREPLAVELEREPAEQAHPRARPRFGPQELPRGDGGAARAGLDPAGIAEGAPVALGPPGRIGDQHLAGRRGGAQRGGDGPGLRLAAGGDAGPAAGLQPGGVVQCRADAGEGVRIAVRDEDRARRAPLHGARSLRRARGRGNRCSAPAARAPAGGARAGGTGSGALATRRDEVLRGGGEAALGDVRPLAQRDQVGFERAPAALGGEGARCALRIGARSGRP